MDKLKELHDRIQTFQVEDYYEPNDMIKILNIMGDLVGELRRIEAANIKSFQDAAFNPPNAPDERSGGQ